MCVRGETLCWRGGEKVGKFDVGPGDGCRFVCDGAALRASDMARGEDTVLSCEVCCVLDHTVCAVDEVDVVVSEGAALGIAEEWARKAARKFERNGRLLVMIFVVGVCPR